MFVLIENGVNDSCCTTTIIIRSWVKRMMIERWIDGSQLQIEEYNGVPFVKQSVPGIAAAGKRQSCVIGTCNNVWMTFF